MKGNKVIDKVLEAMSELEPGQEAVLKIRFGLENGAPATSSEIADQLGTTPEDVRLLEEGALRALMGYKRFRTSSN